MAAGYYQFTFGGSAGSDIAVAFSTAANGPWTAYAEPAWPPNNANRGSVLVVNPNDTVGIEQTGPATFFAIHRHAVDAAHASKIGK